MAARLDGARRPMSQQARSTARGRTAAIIPGASASRASRTTCLPGPRRPCAPFVRRCSRCTGCGGSVGRRRRSSVSCGALRWRARSPPTAPSRRSRRRSGRCSSAGRSSRCRRSGIAVAVGWWLWAVRRVNAAHPGEPGAASSDRGVPGRDDGPRVRAAVGDRPLRHDAVLGPHGPARAADARRRPAHRAGGADHPRASTELIRDAPALDPARSCIRGSCGSWRTPSRPG